MTILVVGDANADLSAALRRFPAEGDDSPIDALAWGSGGAAANVAAALALLGAPARLLARVGRDPAAEIALRVAHAAGVDLTLVQIDDSVATGLCFAAVSPGGERTFFSYRGANVALTLAPPGALLEGARWLHIAGHALLEGEQRVTTLALLAEAAARDIPISLDLCLPLLRDWRDHTLALLPHLAIVFMNEPELALFEELSIENTELKTLRAEHSQFSILNSQFTLHAVRRLLEHGVGAATVKLGAGGCFVATIQRHYHAPAFRVAAIDTNGCGDAFVAGFLCAHLAGQSLESCAALANALGALTATRAGSAEALPDPDTLRAFLAEHQEYALLALVG